MTGAGKPIDVVKMAKSFPMVKKVEHVDVEAGKILTSYTGTIDGIGCRDAAGRWLFTTPEDAMGAARATHARFRQQLGMPAVSE